VTNQYNSWHHNCKIDGQRRRSGRPAPHDRVDLAVVYEFPPGFAPIVPPQLQDQPDHGTARAMWT